MICEGMRSMRVREGPGWRAPLEILYGSGDFMTSPEAVAEFARSNHAGLTVMDGGEQQKSMQNSYHQYKNAVDKLALKSEAAVPENIILVDDMVDSKWTLTVAGGLLTGAGAENVIPFCLADSSNSGD